MHHDVIIPIMFTKNAAAAVPWYERMGFKETSVHRFAPHMPAFVTIERGTLKIFLSEHKGDARPDTLIYIAIKDLRPIAQEFGVEIEECPWGLEIELQDPDQNRIRIGMPKSE